MSFFVLFTMASAALFSGVWAGVKVCRLERGWQERTRPDPRVVVDPETGRVEVTKKIQVDRPCPWCGDYH